QLHADRNRHRPADQAGEDREHQVHAPDVFVVRGIDEPPPSVRKGVLVMSVVRYRCVHVSQVLTITAVGTALAAATVRSPRLASWSEPRRISSWRRPASR